MGPKYTKTSLLAIFVFHVHQDFEGKLTVLKEIIQKIQTSMDVIQVCFKITNEFTQFANMMDNIMAKIYSCS